VEPFFFATVPCLHGTGAVVRCFRSATLSKLASRTAITWPVPIVHCVTLLLVYKELAQKKHKKDTKKVYKVDVEINKFCYNGQVI